MLKIVQLNEYFIIMLQNIEYKIIQKMFSFKKNKYSEQYIE
jgi:hypothetical protein